MHASHDEFAVLSLLRFAPDATIRSKALAAIGREVAAVLDPNSRVFPAEPDRGVTGG